MFDALLPVTGPVMVCVLIGFIWQKVQWPYDTEMVTRLVMCVGAPCLIVSKLTGEAVSRTVIEDMLWVTLAMIVISLVLGCLVIMMARQSIRSYLGALVFPNAGNMGLPVCLFAFGERGLALALAVFMVLSMAHFTIGIALSSGRSVFREMVSNPIIYSIMIAIGMLYSNVHLPLWMDHSVNLLGDITIPLMLMTLGVSLASMKVSNLGKSTALAFARLGIGVLVGVGVATIFGLQGTARGVVILQSAMPVAVFNYLFAMRYQREPNVIAGMIMVSTLGAFFYIPLLIRYVI